MKLFEKGNIGKVVLKNRIVMAPMGTPADIDGGFTEGNIDYYVERAKGGTGLIITGCTVVNEDFEPRPCNLHNNFHQNDRMGLLADKIHQYGAKLCVQLSPGIGRMNFIDPFTPPYSASAVPSYAFPELICREMPIDGIKRLVKDMGYSASLCQRAGVDMVEVHAYGGYLIDQFTSAYWNKRTDEYGGSFENRTRFLREIIEEIRNSCGKDFPIAVKLTIDSIYPQEERPFEEGKQLAKMLSNMGISLLHVGRGSYFCRFRMVSSVYQPQGFDLEAIKEIKELVPDIPIMGHGKLNHPDVAEKAIAEGYMDYVAIGHGLLADPHWSNKVKKKQFDDIVPCIGCGECHYNAMNGKILSCAVNPCSGHEKDYALTGAHDKKKVLVIGAGPGGMKAAITAAQRDFEVAIWEKRNILGGEMAAAGSPRFKQDVAEHVAYLTNQLKKYDIDLRMGITANVDAVKVCNPDFVVVATGAEPVVLKVPGYDKSHVTLAEKVLLEENDIGQNVVVVGGGLVGCETAVELSMQGKNVTIIEMLDDILKVAAHFVANDQNLRHLVTESSVNIMTGAKLTEIKDDSVLVETSEGLKEILCDNVVFAVGYRSDHTLYDQICEAGFECVQIGDNVKPGKIMDAIHAGYHSIRVL